MPYLIVEFLPLIGNNISYDTINKKLNHINVFTHYVPVIY